jgi:hypothetical protein
MKRIMFVLAITIIGHPMLASDVFAQWTGSWRIQVTNLTSSQTFTPFLAATHTSDVMIFSPGMSATPELQALAENGNVMPLAMLLNGISSVMSVETGSMLTPPGATAEINITGSGLHRYVSLAAMLIPTNDVFVGASTELPTTSGVLTTYAYAYDAGTEVNDETCASIPGPNFPECAGPGMGGSPGNGEGAVVISNGILGIGDFERDRDWKNPVARITILRVS